MPDSWMPTEAWNDMQTGNNPFAEYVRKPFQEILVTERGYWLADLERSRVYMNRNQFAKGYCTLVARESVSTPHAMYLHQRRLFFDDMIRVGSALEKVFDTLTINYLIANNTVPHLHVQIVPRYHDDDLSLTAVDPDAQTQHLDSEDDYQTHVADIREAMGFSREIITDPLLIKFMDEKACIKDWPPLKHEDSQKAVRTYLASKFEVGKKYTEKEVNALLNQWATFEDWALLRCELFGAKYLNRMKDGSAYWVNEERES
ncbi:MAG: DUF2087 domain-containing protein [Chloroflexota bacterium]